MRALVTGGCGFIGSNLTHKLVELGWTVDVVDDLSNGHLELLSDLNLRTITSFLVGNYNREKDPRNPQVVVIVDDFACDGIVANIVNKKYDYIFHMAALPRVEYSVQNPIQTYDVNVVKTLKLMTHAIDNIKRFVFSSSSSVYGEPWQLPTTEACGKNPVSPYALQKMHVEELGRLYSTVYNMDFVSLRYFNVYGPGQYGDSPYSTAIAAWCDKVRDKLPLRSDGDGTQSRDLVYVDDVVSANLAAATREEKFTGQAYNVGSSTTITNNEILEKFKNKFEGIQVRNAEWRPGDVKNTLADIEYAKEDFGWFPVVRLEEGLAKTFEWWDFDEES
jgi:nucleoside-diphosphate-sugar epimerase